MLSDAQKEQLSAEMVPVFQELEQDVIKDIARRVRKEKRWTETAELQAKELEALGYSPAKIRSKVLRELHADKAYNDMLIKNTLEHKKMVRERINKAVTEARKRGDDIVSKAGFMSFADDVSFWESKGKNLKGSPELQLLGKEHSKRLAHELKSLTHSTGFKFIGKAVREGKAFNESMDRAIMNVASGTFSSQQAIEQVVSDLEKSGLRKVDFASGVSRGIDVAVHLAVRTTLGQMAADISMSNADELGTDLVEVTSHAGAREGEGHANHASWQGKVYSISGKPHPEESKRLGYKIEKLSEATGYPDDPTGLCGYNCRHTFYPFIEGVSEPNSIEKDPEPVVVDGKTYTYYQATQKQRRLERELRELKRQHIGGDDKTAAIIAREQQYAKYCQKAGLKQNLNRLYVKGYKRDFAYIKSNAGVQAAKELITVAKRKDIAITPDLKKIVFASGGRLEGLQYRIKSEESLYRKLVDKADAKGISIGSYSRQVTDCLRYTVVGERNNFARVYASMFDNLRKKGYTVVGVKNTLKNTDAPYRGVNALVRDKGGYIFELQYHTPQSLKVKEENHALYEEYRLSSTTSDRRNKLMLEMVKNSKTIKAPPGIENIKEIERL